VKKKQEKKYFFSKNLTNIKKVVFSLKKLVFFTLKKNKRFILYFNF